MGSPKPETSAPSKTTPAKSEGAGATTPVKSGDTGIVVTPNSAKRRRARFASSEMPNREDGEEDEGEEEEDEDYDESSTEPVVGTCQVFEKPYFRLTSV